MSISAVAKRISKLVLLAAGVGLLAPVAGSVVAQAAPITYCGDYSYDWWGSPQTASSTYNASIGKCEVVFNFDNSPTVDNFALPRHVTSVDILAVGAGGSGAMDATNWTDYIYSQGSTDNIVSTDSGGGGGGGAIWEASGYSVNSNFRFSLVIGQGGQISQFGSALGQGYLGNDGGNTTVAINNGSTTTTLTAGGGRAPNPHYNAGSGGTASPASFSGWVKSNGSAGRALGSTFSVTNPIDGYWVNGASPFGTIAQGGGGAVYNSASNVYSSGQRASTYGSGGGGGMINNGAWFPQDLGCFVFNDNRCDGQSGAVRFTWAALDYEPASPVDANWPVQLTSVAPKLGNTLTTYQAFNGSPTPTISYQWFRCNSQTYDSPQSTLPAGCTAIAGATGNSYTVVSADLGKYLINRVTAANSGTSGSTTVTYYTPSSNVAVNTPAAPTLGAPTVLGPSSVRFAYTPSANWGEWRGYTVKVTTGGTTVDRTGTYNSSNGTLTVTGLTANTAYTFQALEYNSDAGNGALSATQSATTLLAVTAPSAPTITGPDFRSGKTVTFTGSTWSGNQTPTVTSQFYYCTSAQTALYQSEGSAPIAGCTAFDVANPTTVTLPAAAAGRHLMLLQTATDTFSTSYYRSASTLVTGEWDAPTINRNERVNGWADRVAVFWNWPAFKGCASTPSNARYMISTDNGVTWGAPVTVANAGSSQIISGLTLGVTYSFRFAQGVTCNGTVFYSGYSEVTTRTLEEPRVETAPTISGIPTIGATFTLNTGTWSGGQYAGRGAANVTQIRWYACTTSRSTTYFGADPSWAFTNCTQITGQTASTLATTYAQFGNSTARLHLTAMLNVTDNYTTYYHIYPTTLMSRVPTAPTDVNFGSGTPTATSLPVSWTAPTIVGAAAISGYKVSYSAGPSFSTWTTPTAIGSTNTNFTITGLTSGVEYKVRVFATNSIGDSVASTDSVAIATLQAPAISGIPTVTGTAGIGQTLTGSTSALTITGNPTPSLTYAWFSCDTAGDAATLTGTCAAIAGETSTTLTVAAAQAQKYLVFRVSATNSLATVNARSAATAQVPGTPSAVTGVTPVVSGTSSISVTFAAPTDTGGGSIVEYQYKYAASPFSTYSAWVALPDLTRSFQLTGLSSNTAYRVIVRAVNAIGSGAESAASNSVTTLGAPLVAAAPTIAGTPHVGQTITATEPGGLFTGNPLPTVSTRAWYSCATAKNAGDALSDCSAIAGANGISFTVTATQVSSYLVYAVVGTNSVGNITASSASTAIVANVPAAPSVTMVSLSGSGTAVITLSAGAANNSAITGYQFELNGSGSWVSTGAGTNTTFILAGLTNGQVTGIKVRALNAVGASLASTNYNLTALAAAPTPSASRTDSGLTVSWSSLAGATGYSLSISTQAGSGYATVSGSCSATSGTSCAVTGLTNGQPYYLKLVASNANGSSAASAAAGPFTPLSQDTTLSSLIVRSKVSNAATAIGATLSPAFAANTRSYSAEVASGNQFATITPTRNVAGQVIKVNGAVVASGSQSADLALSFGANSFTIEVQSVEKVADSASTSVATYAVSITRANPDMSGFTSFASTNTAASPITSSYAALGITSVTNANLASINSAIAALPSSAVDSPAEVQAVVNAYVSILGQSIGGTPTTTPTAASYTALGISSVGLFTAPQVSYLNQVIASLNTVDVSTVADVARIAAAIENVYLVAAGSPSGAAAITVEQLAAIGVVGVTSANLADVVTALAATADDGSGINTVAKIQAIVNSVKAASVTAIATATGQTAPAPSVFASAGVVGVSSENLAAVTAVLASLPANAKDSTAEIQDAVNSMTMILAQAQGASASVVQAAVGALGVQSVSSGPTASNYASIGASTAANLSSSGISLLNSIIGVLPTSAIDSPTELNTLAAAASTIQTNVVSASVSDFALIGLRGVTSSNLTAVRALISAASLTSKDSLTELQAIIDNSATVAAATSFANSSGAPVTAPTVQDFLGLGVTGVSSANISALNQAIRAAAGAANPPGSWVATQSVIQTLVTNLSTSAVTTLSTYNGTGTAPAASDYQALGVVGVRAANLAAVNEIVAALPASATDSPVEVQRVVNAYLSVINAAKSSQASSITLEDLQALGVTGVTQSNFAAIAASIAQATAADVDSLTEIQTLVAAAAAEAVTSVAAITSFAANPIAAPALSVYLSSGVVGVSSSNKAMVDAALTAANPAPTTVAQIQAIVDSVVAAPVALIASPTAVESVRAADFALAGITGVTTANRDAVVGILAALPSAARDSVVEVQKAIDSFVLVSSIARGNSNAAPDAAKPSVADFSAIGVDLGVIATDPEAFTFFLSVLSKLPAEVVSSPVAISERAAIVADLLRAASNKEPVSTITPEKFAAIGVTGVTSSNIQQVMTEMASAPSGQNGLVGLEVAAVRYASPIAAPVVTPTPTPTPTNPNPEPTPTPTPTPTVRPVVVPAPATVSFAAGTTALSTTARRAVETQVTRLLKANVKTVTVQAVVTLPRNASTAWRNQVLAAAKARAESVARVAAARAKTLGSKAKVVTRITTTTKDGVRDVKISGK